MKAIALEKYGPLVGNRFGKLTILALIIGKRPAFDCQCDCGNKKLVRVESIVGNITVSCGCFRREKSKTHGMEGTRTYNSWQAMLERCYRQKHPHYHRYGGRGIFVCDQWRHSFENFFADMGKRPDGKTLDRINNDLGYSKENCEWADRFQQATNRSNTRFIIFNGETKSMSEWSRMTGLNITTIKSRLDNGWSAELTLTSKARRYG